MGLPGERQRWVWLAAGLSAVAAITLCGISWPWVLLGGLLAGGYYYYIDVRLGETGVADVFGQWGLLGKVLAVVLLFWTVFAMGVSASFADAAFPMVDGFPGLGLVLLAMAAWGSRKGAAACAGCSGILSLFLLVLYGSVVGFALPDVELACLVPGGKWQDAVFAAGMFLLPGAVWCIPVREKKGRHPVLAVFPVLFAGVLSAVTAGVLSPQLAEGVAVPLYELARSVSVLGVVERIEPLLSAAMTMGVFCLLSVLSCACQALGDQVAKWPWTGSLCCLAAAGVMVVTYGCSYSILAAGNLVFFLLFPTAAAVFGKKLKKLKIDVDKGSSG